LRRCKSEIILLGAQVLPNPFFLQNKLVEWEKKMRKKNGKDPGQRHAYITAGIPHSISISTSAGVATSPHRRFSPPLPQPTPMATLLRRSAAPARQLLLLPRQLGAARSMSRYYARDEVSR
jgi:hypothetical protein